MHFEYITTDRLKLRLITPEAYKAVFQEYTDDEIKLFFGLQSDDDLKKERIKYEKGMTTYNRSFILFQLIDKRSDTVIGGCGLHNWMPDHSRSEIGYALNNDAVKQKGLMTEAIRPIIDYGFNTLHLNRIEAFIGANNVASQKLIRKMKFKQEGCLREHYCKEGVLEDSWVFSLLKSEYEAG
jgi:ribosomal-protein-alanine N-acetyltransferase